MSGTQGRYPVSMAPAAGLAGPYRAGSRGGARGRALPIVAASGLAMGVFAGLFVVRGTGGEDGPLPVAAGVEDPPPSGASAAASPPGSSPSTPSTAAASAPSAPGSGASLDAGTGSAAAPPAPEAPAAPATAVLSFSVRPRRAHILVDGVEIEGTRAEVPLTNGSATVEVVVRGRGYKTFTRSYTVTEDEDIQVKLPRERDEPSGPGGLLDIR